VTDPDRAGAAASATLALLAEAGSATVHEAADRTPLLDPAIRPIQQGASIAGRAFAVRCERNDNLAVHRAVAEATSGSILIVDAQGVPRGFWGAILTEAAMARGIVGLVMDGGVRDTAVIRSLGFPVWSRHIAAQGVDKKLPGQIGDTVRCGGVRVVTGMVVVADDDGVVAFDHDLVDKIEAATRARLDREVEIVDRLRGGDLTLDLLGLRPLLEARGD
jgi:4-hydroxy-4-methyl-2-oxoglutarate aldolase